MLRQLLARSSPVLTRATARSSPSSSLRLYSAATSSTPAPPPATDGESHLKQKLAAALEGAKIVVEDVSGGCGTFYAIQISHPSFKGLSTIKQHRVVNAVLKDDIAGMHGLQLKTSAE